MLNKKVIIIGSGMVLVLAGVMFFSGKEEAVQTPLESQVNAEGSVEIEVLPLDVSATSDTWQFKIVLNTHSTELNHDLLTVSVLRDEKGNEYLPIKWEGAAPGGHHREGILYFKPISPKPDMLLLVVRDIGEIEERTFTWEL